MAGRGVDIKLGGELNEEVLADVIHVLERAGVADPFDMSNDARRNELLKLTSEEYSVYEESVNTFLEYLENSKKVRVLGGLHVIGSERHEARRIDNQLRGRAARQGDPGSSRFYLSLEDELMRLFGGPSMESLMGRLKVDPSLPIESNLLGRMVEQAQERVEGNNFDVRKHLLEYDDVLNAQRQRIYSERDRAFEKEDLAEDVDDILTTELKERISKVSKDEEGNWKLLSFLDEVQPTNLYEQENVRTPSFTVHQVIDEVRRRYGNAPFDRYELTQLLLNVAGESVRLENEHILSSTHTLISKTMDSVNEILSERTDILDRYLESAKDPDEETQQVRRPQQLLEQISNETRTLLRLNSDELKRLPDGGSDVRETLLKQLSGTLNLLAVSRLLGSIERRLDESLNLRPQQLIDLDWDEIGDGIMQSVSTVLQKREETLTSPQGPIGQNIEAYLNKVPLETTEDDRLCDLLMEMSFGTRVAIDPRTHQRVFRRILLINYIYFAASLIEALSPQALTDEVLDHLQETLQKLETVWGKVEFERFRMANVTVSQLEPWTQNQFMAERTEEESTGLLGSTGDQLSEEERQKLTRILGYRTQNEINRHTLVSVISDLWVDHLTKMEALRVSIGLEAFAQRDPLVQYKSRGSEMFKELLSDIRIGVISRIFRYQPRRPGQQNQQEQRAVPAEVLQAQATPALADRSQKKKRRRH
jgi:preprotein translocase subunit SecA